MTTTQLVALAFLATWTTSSVGLGLLMRRRGYSGFGWGVIGAILGPLGVLVALARQDPRRGEHWSRAGLPARGTVDVLVATDGSVASIAAATAAVGILEDRLGRVTVATVEPHDATPEEADRARQAVEGTTAALSDRLQDLAGVPGVVVLHGRPADALLAFAHKDRYELIVLGSHGRGRSSLLLGSTAAHLLHESTVPLLVAGRGVASVARPGASDAVAARAGGS